MSALGVCARCGEPCSRAEELCDECGSQVGSVQTPREMREGCHTCSLTRATEADRAGHEAAYESYGVQCATQEHGADAADPCWCADRCWSIECADGECSVGALDQPEDGPMAADERGMDAREEIARTGIFS